MISHALFSTLVCEFHYPNHQEFRESFLSDGLKFFDADGYSGENTGHVAMHHEPNFEDLYKFGTECIVNYLNEMNIDSDNFDIHIIKSWLNVLKSRNTPKHNHRDAHVSLVYYVNAPDEYNQRIVFLRDDPHFDVFPGCIKNNNSKNIWNSVNSYTWSFVPKQGTLYVFPASLNHETEGNGSTMREEGVFTHTDLLQRRISIASDALLTYKEKSSKSLGIQPISNWKKFA